MRARLRRVLGGTERRRGIQGRVQRNKVTEEGQCVAVWGQHDPLHHAHTIKG